MCSAFYTHCFCDIDILQTEIKGTVLIKIAKELKDFRHGEENLLEQQIKLIADTGAKVVVACAFGDLALHYCNKYDLMTVRLNSKFDLQRLSKAINATFLPRLTPPKSLVEAAATVIRVDQIIMAKRAGRPEPRQPGVQDQDDN